MNMTHTRPTSGARAGLCNAFVALTNTIDKSRADVSIVDDVLAVCAARKI